ncbi:MAG TPA: PepSY domain-containing protein [Frateuria sp.]|uniref:PepSY domain-containing protein n=1 Tax=Frateuria sp. TaxID=2211372 RepID=UPI002DE9E0CD|nr:PepSY domain-containing protein [Frateuria sp.]
MKSLDEELKGKKYLKQARIQPEQARTLALRAFDGRIVYERIESKPGGSGLRYSFVIRNSRAEKRRVDIDANDGATLENTPTRERW